VKTERRRWRKWAVLCSAAGFLIGFVMWMVWPNHPRTQEEASVAIGIWQRMDDVSAVVRVSGWEPTGDTYTRGDWDGWVAAVDVEEVLFDADDVDDVDGGGRVQPGRLLVGGPQTTHSPGAMARRSDEMVLLLRRSSDTRTSAGVSPHWFATLVAQETPDGVKFIASTGDQWLLDHWEDEIVDLLAKIRAKAGLDTPAGHRDAAVELALLVDWAREASAYRGADTPGPGPVYGPITNLYLGHDTTYQQHASLVAWYALPPEERPLDPELTPDAVLRELSASRVLVDLDNAVTAEGLLILRTPTGVAHQAELGAGPHPAEVLTRTGETWTIWVSHGGALYPLGAVPPTIWQGRFGVAITITRAIIDEALAGKEARAAVRSVSQSEFQALIAAMAGRRADGG